MCDAGQRLVLSLTGRSHPLQVNVATTGQGGGDSARSKESLKQSGLVRRETICRYLSVGAPQPSTARPQHRCIMHAVCLSEQIPMLMLTKPTAAVPIELCDRVQIGGGGSSAAAQGPSENQDIAQDAQNLAQNLARQADGLNPGKVRFAERSIPDVCVHAHASAQE